MKNVLPAFLLRLTLLFAAFAIVSVATASAQSAKRRSRPVMLPPFIVAEDRFVPPEVNSDGTITLPNGAVINSHFTHSDGSITLPDGAVLALPHRSDSDGTVMLPDGTVVMPNADGTVTLADGTLIDPSPHAKPRSPRPAHGG